MGLYDTFLDLQDRTKDDLADHTDTFFSPNEVMAALNTGLWEIYKVLHSENHGYYFNTTPEIITLDTTTNYYVLTDDFAWVDEIRPQDDSDRQRRFLYKSRHDQEFRDLLNLPTDQLYSNSDQFYYDVVSDKTLVIAPRVTTSMVVEVYPVSEPTEMTLDGDIPPIKKIWRHLVVEYAVRKLKNKEETGEYQSNAQLLAWLLENLSKYAGPRGGTNQLVVEDYLP